MTEPLILPFRHGPFRNVSYVVADPASRRALAIDPAWEVETILAGIAAEGLELAAVVLSHGHHDHVHGVAEIVEATGAAVFAHAAENLAELQQSHSGPVTRLSGGETLELGSLAAEVMHTPGHTAGSVLIRVGEHLFTGDTMMVASMGRPGPKFEAVEAMWDTVTRIFARLDGNILVHPGHDSGPAPLATMAEQRERIPALRAASFDAFIEAMERETGRILRPES